MWIAFCNGQTVGSFTSTQKAIIECNLTCPQEYVGVQLDWEEVQETKFPVLEVEYTSRDFAMFKCLITKAEFKCTGTLYKCKDEGEYCRHDFGIEMFQWQVPFDKENATLVVRFHCKEEDSNSFSRLLWKIFNEFPLQDHANAITDAMAVAYCNYLANLKDKEMALC